MLVTIATLTLHVTLKVGMRVSAARFGFPPTESLLGFPHSMRREASIFFSLWCMIALLAAGCGQRLDPKAELALPPPPSQVPPAQFQPNSAGYTNWWLQWSRELCVGGYQQVGTKHPRWDAAAINALEEYAHWRVTGRARDPAASDYLETQIRQAIKAGCSDPLIRYIHLRMFLHPPNLASPQIAAQYADLAKQMDGTGYANIFKFYANLRAAQAWRAAAAKQAPEVNPLRRAAMNYLHTILLAEEIPAHAAHAACQELYEAIDRNNRQRADFYLAAEPVLLKRWRKQGFPYLIKAQFYIDYAWEARGGGWAKDVTPEGWRLFGDRLRLADAALKQAAKLDPGLPQVALVGLRLQFGAEEDREQMELWYQRAIKFPQNRYEAVRQKLRYLHPQWYGSEEECLGFAREVVKSASFFGREPLQLYHTHEALADYFGKSRPDYWTEAQVWPDLKASFERFFEVSGDDNSWRHNYVMCAWRCRQWPAFDEEAAKLTDINYAYFGGQEAFEEVKRFAREQRQSSR